MTHKKIQSVLVCTEQNIVFWLSLSVITKQCSKLLLREVWSNWCNFFFFFFVKTYCYFSAVTIEKYIFGILYCFLAFLEFVTNMLGVVKWSSYIEAKFLHSMFPGSMSSEAVSIPNRCPQNTGMWLTNRCVQLTAGRNTKHSHKQQQLLLVFLSDWTG